MENEQLMTVGELAQRVGVSVRTVQYYDQKGLLHPTQVGASGQRLYSKEDEVELHHILVLKYLGLSLSDIAERMESTRNRAELKSVVDAARNKLDEELIQYLERMSVLRELGQMVESGDSGVDWLEMTDAIDRNQKDKKEFWQKLGAEGVIGFAGLTREEILAWHALMGETIEAMQTGATPDDPRGRELGERFKEMGGMSIAMAGLARMGGGQAGGMPPQAMGSSGHGRDFYHFIQDKTLGFLQEAAEE